MRWRGGVRIERESRFEGGKIIENAVIPSGGRSPESRDLGTYFYCKRQLGAKILRLRLRSAQDDKIYGFWGISQYSLIHIPGVALVHTNFLPAYRA